MHLLGCAALWEQQVCKCDDNRLQWYQMESTMVGDFCSDLP